MDIDKEKEAFSRWVLTHPDNLDITSYEENIMFDAWQAARAQANKQFENFIDQAIEDSACADERQSYQRLLKAAQDVTLKMTHGEAEVTVKLSKDNSKELS